MNLFSVPADIPFLDALAAAWLAEAAGEPARVADGLILLPTRRAARALAEAFLRQSGGRPLLLPRIIAFGALDEAPLALAGALDLAPAVPPMLRLAHLTRLILALDGASGAPLCRARPRDNSPAIGNRRWNSSPLSRAPGHAGSPTTQ